LRKTLKPLGVELIFPTAPREIRPAEVSDPNERAKLQEIEEQGEEWQYFGWCVRDDNEKDMKDLDKSVEFIGKVMETEVPALANELTCRVRLWGYWDFHRVLHLLLRLRRCWRRKVHRPCFHGSIILL
jgi:Serine hydrolase (FSH1)